MHSVGSLLLCCAALVGCSAANAKTLDPQNDVHCSVLAFYFHRLAEHRQMPEDQIRPARVLQLWYAVKMQDVIGDRKDNPARFDKETGPLLEAVKADYLAMRDEMAECANRAASDPNFPIFVQRFEQVEPKR